VCAGDTASFFASASGTPAPAIQWQVMPSGGGGFSDLIGETADSLRFAALASQNGNQYRARFSNSCGTTYSAPASVLWCPGNNAPVVTITGPPIGVTFVIGNPVTFTGSFTDDSGDTHTAVWTIGGVDFPGVVNDSTGSVTADHVFTSAGTFAIKLTVTDQGGANGISTQMLGGLGAIVVISDGSAGLPESLPRRIPELGAKRGLDLQFGLPQNAPNPFRSATQVRFSLPVQCLVKLGVFDVAGRQVASLSNQVWEAGSHTLDWSGRTDGGDLAPGGVYILRMVARTTTGDGHYNSQKTMIRIN
jgi:hypothetical protein